MYPHQRERLGEALARVGAEALVATSPANIAYLTGFWSLSEARYRAPQLAVFAPGGTALIVPAIDVPAAVAEGVEADHLLCVGTLPTADAPASAEARRAHAVLADGADRAEAALARALERLGVPAGRVGVDETRLTPAGWQAVADALAGRPVAAAADAFAEARRVKAPWEIECLHRALGIAEEALDVVVQALDPGVTEREAAALFGREVIARQGVPAPSLVAFGDRTAVPAGWPGDRRLRAGDLVRLDVGCAHRGYCASVARTAVMGEPAADVQEAYAVLEAGLERALDAVRPGVTAGTVHAAAVEPARAAGAAAAAAREVGHGIGLERVERPRLAAGSGLALEMGEVVCVELGHLALGRLGLGVRDTVLVTDRSAVRMNRSTRALVTLD